MKRFIMGLIVGLVLSGGVMAANNQFNGYDVVGVFVDGSELKSDVPAIVMNGRTLLPVRAICDKLGAKVNFDENNNSVIITSDSIIDDRENASDNQDFVMLPTTIQINGKKTDYKMLTKSDSSGAEDLYLNAILLADLGYVFDYYQDKDIINVVPENLNDNKEQYEKELKKLEDDYDKAVDQVMSQRDAEEARTRKEFSNNSAALNQALSIRLRPYDQALSELKESFKQQKEDLKEKYGIED